MTMQPVSALPIDADLWWSDYMRDRLTGRIESYVQAIYIGRKVPPSRRNHMLIVRRDGGSVTGLLDRPRITLDCWAKSDKDVADLASLVTALAFDAPGTNGCVRVVHLSGPNDVTEASGQPRRSVLIEATHRTDVLAP